MIPKLKHDKRPDRHIEKELKNREDALYRCAVEVEQDEALNSEMKAWDDAVGDGLGFYI